MVIDMDMVKKRIRELIKLSNFSLREKASILKLQNIEDVGKVKLAVLIAIEENKDSLHSCQNLIV